MELESRRGRRRRLTETIARRRRSDFIRRWYNGELPKGHKGAHSLVYWAGDIDCSCTKRRKGCPRLGRGMCDYFARERIYALRARARELNRLVCRGADLEGDEVALLSVRPINNLW